jgi:hypothetical protein
VSESHRLLLEKLENFEKINTKGVHKGDTTLKTLVLQGVKKY